MRARLPSAALATCLAWWTACSSFGDGPTSAAPDAAPDAAPEVGPDPGCSAFFCDGFERTANVGQGWNSVSTPVAATLSLSTLHAKTGAGSLELALRGDAPTGPRTAYLLRELPPASTKTVLDFWIFYEQAPSTDTTVAAVGLHTLDGNIIALLRSNGSFVLNEQWRPDAGVPLANGTGVAVGTIAVGVPRHVTLEVGTDVGAKLTVDGESGVFSLVNPDPRPKRVYLGSTFSAQGTRDEDKIWFDDLVVEASPR